MSGPYSDQGPSKPKLPDDLAPATGRLASAPASKSKSWFKSKAQKAFSSSKLSQSTTLNTKPPRGGPPQFSDDKTTVQESVETLISRPIVELWDEAYDELSRKDKSLVADYEALLFKSLAEADGSSAMVLSELGKVQRCQEMKVLLKRRIKEIGEGEWKLKYKDHELAVKDLVEPVVGVLDLAQNFVSTALESSPYGSIAWAGVCLLLPVSTTFAASRWPYFS